ncbi:hypothetical protein V5R04_14370 [Jonesiaceae bacterium BS-20]|uniref:Uncharacterized protein n=1 Tax=Jonesiaceae bacterium BS-20 TaxID=3120821 RepID=A0AAU7DVZ9_9MICO
MDQEQQALGALAESDIHVFCAKSALRGSGQVQWVSTNAQRYLELVDGLAEEVSALDSDINALRSLTMDFFAQLPQECLAVIW